jgi:signal transduction histidine kinase
MLSASVAHELNTPLAVLNGSIEKLIESFSRDGRDPQTLERLARMQRVAQRLQRISESLVGFSKVRKQQMEPLALRPLVEEAWGPGGDRRKILRRRIRESDPRRGSRDRKLGPLGAGVRESAAQRAERDRGNLGSHRSPFTNCGEGRAALDPDAVEDNGRGIPPDVLPDIFDAFVTTRLDARGTGLGLTVAEGIVIQHGGTIAAANRAEGGARLEVMLPSA